ncbi:MAG: acyl-CoA thioesterase [Zoogloea sp.]|nr:acyl-CoA thioesterase [Zoogloea sp.]MBP7393516.1 acyl-CoA thioesterase [Zoogloea sp.]
MARVLIELPAQFVFSTEVPIYITHINKAQHLDNAALIALLSEARVRFFRSLGYDELDVDGVGIVVADMALQYKSEAFHGETLTFEMTPDDFNKYGCDLAWRASDKATGREVARGKTGILFFDYAARRPAPVPQGFLARTASMPT